MREQLLDAAASQLEPDGLHAMQLYVARAGQTIVDDAVGELTADVRLQVFSTSKSVTGYAIALLAARGLLLHHDPIARYVPEFAAQGKRGITISDAFLHRAGIPDSHMRFVLPSAFADWDAMVKTVCDLPLEWAPRTQTVYHPLAIWGVLGELVARVDGRDFATFCRDEIFGPLNLVRTSWGIQSLDGARLIRAGDPGQAEAVRQFTDERVWRSVIPGGGLWSTARELGRIYQSLLDAQLLPHLMVDFITAQGYGFVTGPVEAGSPNTRGTLASPRSFGHNGGASCTVWADPESRVVMSIVCDTARGGKERRFNVLSDIAHRGGR